MSTSAIERVVNDLKELPESDQEIVVSFLQALRRRHSARQQTRQRREPIPALVEKHGRRVFTGKLKSPDIDWVRADREEREQEILRQALG